MDWIRENKPLAAILGVIIAGSLALGYLLFAAWSSYSEKKEAYLSMGSQVAGLKGARLAPTEQNVAAKRGMVAEYAKRVKDLGDVVLYLQNEKKPAPTSDIEFQDKLKAKISEVRKTSAAAQMHIPADFAFGFDEYTTTLPKSGAVATELSGYLDAVDELVKLFMKCGVKSVDLLDRAKLPIETQTAPQPNMQGQAMAGITEKRKISVVLTLDQGPLQLLVSGLTNPSDMPYFTSLRLLRIENQKQDGPLRSEVKLPVPQPPSPGGATTAGGGGAEAKEQVSDEIKPPPPAFPDAVSVFGQEMLKVRLEIDLVKFLDSAAGVAAQAPAPGPGRAPGPGQVPAGR
ncbi:Amuc_1100 family pilus-like protein [Prosthecobacter sp.]|uniref:Amuc_1100 family pilus-like protein n=1 Tax=Prosthecobacter sp. TaxID=1965333 RepID=UPI00378529C6